MEDIGTIIEPVTVFGFSAVSWLTIGLTRRGARREELAKIGGGASYDAERVGGRGDISTS